MFTSKDRAAIAVFMTTTQHEKDVRKNFKKLAESYTKEELCALVDRFETSGILSREDARYLTGKVMKMYEE